MKVGRNDPCPCGSGKKSKKCDCRKIKVPAGDGPSRVVPLYLKTPGQEPRQIHGAKMRLNMISQDDYDPKVYESTRPLHQLSKKHSLHNFEKRLHAFKHKLNAVSYHLRAIEKEIQSEIDRLQKENTSFQEGAEGQHLNSKLIYETEAFLFQVKSSLDVLTQALGKGGVVPCLKDQITFRSKGKRGEEGYVSGGKVISTLSQQGFGELAEIFQNASDKWITNLVIMRDQITHYSALKDFKCFIEERDSSGRYIHVPKMPSGIAVNDYCNNVYSSLLDLIAQIATHLKDKEIPLKRKSDSRPADSKNP